MGSPCRALSAFAWLLVNLLQGLFTVFWTVGWISVALLLAFLTGRRELGLWLARRVWAPGLLFGAGAHLEVEGLKGLDCSRPYLLVANHQSWIDIPALFRVVPRPLRFVAKEELARVPFLGAFMRATGMVFLERRGSKRTVLGLNQAAELLREGAWLVSFPEGTRSRDGRLGPFRTGTFAAAIEAGMEVVPIALEGPGVVLPPGGFRVRPGKIRVRFGEPISAANFKSSERARLAREAETAVRNLLAGLREMAPPQAESRAPVLSTLWGKETKG